MRSVLFILLALGLMLPSMSRAEDLLGSSNWIKSPGSGGINEYSYPKSSHINRAEEWSGFGGAIRVYSYSGERLPEISFPSDMPANYQAVTEFAWDDFGNAWLAHHQGVTRYNEKTKVFTHFTMGLGQNRARRVVYDGQSKRLLVGAIDGFASSVVNPDGSLAGWEKMIPEGADHNIHSIGIYGSEVWAQNTNKLYRFVNNAWASYSPADLGTVAFTSTAFVAANGDVWVGVTDTATAFGAKYRLAKFERSSGAWKSVAVEGLNDIDPNGYYIGGAGALSIAIDRNNHMWIAGSWKLMKVENLSASSLTTRFMDKWMNEDINSPVIILGLNPVGGLKVSAFMHFEDTTGLGAYYASVSAIRNPFVRNPSILREKGRFVGTFSINGRMMSNPSVLSSGNYLQVFRTADGRTNVVRTMSLIANPSHGAN
jgi:hypothetical protein